MPNRKLIALLQSPTPLPTDFLMGVRAVDGRGTITTYADLYNLLLANLAFIPTNPTFWGDIYVNGRVNVVQALNYLSTVNSELIPITMSLSQVQASSYGGNDGQVVVTASGPSDLEYSKDDVVYQSSSTLSGFTAGTKTIYVRQVSQPSNKANDIVTVRQAAPVLGGFMSVNNGSTKSFDWTNHASFVSLSDYQYTVNAGVSWSNVTAKPQPLSNTARAVGDVRVRIKAGTTYDASNSISNTQPITTWTLATVTLQPLPINSGITGNSVTQTISASYNLGSETLLGGGVGRLYFNDVEITGVTNSGTDFYVSHTTSVAGTYKAEITTESGIKSSTRSITFSSAPLMVYLSSNATDPYADLLAGTDNLTYIDGPTLATASDPIIADVRFAANTYLVLKVPATVSNRVAWNDGYWDGTTFTPSNFNYGDIPDSVFRERVVIGDWEYYIGGRNSPIALGTESNRRLRLI